MKKLYVKKICKKLLKNVLVAGDIKLSNGSK
jgi:hypothetical protein